MAEQADILIRLGKLLKKKRDKDIQERVDKIAESAIPTEEKIERIENLDRIAVAGQSKERHKKKEEIKQKSKDILNKGIKALEKLKKPSQDAAAAPAKIVPTKFFHYVFHEHKKIKHFAAATGAIEPVFPFKFRITQNAKNILSQRIWDAIYLILKPLNYILREGWKKITKFQYNLAINFLIFCQDFYKIDFRRDRIEDFNTYAKHINLQHYFLRAIQDKNHRDQLYNTIEIMCLDHEKYKNNVNSIIDAAMLILEPSLIKPSLTNIIYSANVVSCRKYIPFDDVLKNQKINHINTTDFECTAEIRYKITSYINEAKLRIEKLEKESAMINLLKARFDDSEKNNDLSILQKVFRYIPPHISNKNPIVFDDFQRDLINFIERLNSNFYLLFDGLFTDNVKIEDSHSEEGFKIVKIMPYDIVSNHVYYIKLSSERLNRFISGHANTKILFADYLDFIETGKTLYENEAEFFRLITETANSFFELGKSLAYLIALPPSENLLDNLKNALPYQDKKIIDNPVFDGLTVNDYLNNLMAYCFAYSRFFKNSKQKILIESEGRIISEIKNIRETLKRLA